MARPRKFQESVVVEAALEQFWSTGYSGTSLDDLSAATGLGRQSLYNAFGDKRSLYLRAFEKYCDDAVVATVSMLEGPDDEAGERLRALMGALVASRVNGPDDQRQACFIAKATAECAALDPSVAGTARRALLILEERLVGEVAAAQRVGDIAGFHDARACGRLILATMRGIEALAQAGIEEAVLSGAASSLLDMLLADPTDSGILPVRV